MHTMHKQIYPHMPSIGCSDLRKKVQKQKFKRNDSVELNKKNPEGKGTMQDKLKPS